MGSPLPIIFTISAVLISGFIIGISGATILRGLKSKSSWKPTTGRIKTFIFNYGILNVTYEYEIDETKYEGEAITPGPTSRRPVGDTLPKSLYLNHDGSLKFPPDSEITVFYNPENHDDAVLIPGLQPGAWKALAAAIAFPLIPLIVWGNRQWFSLHGSQLVTIGLYLFGFLSLGYGIHQLKRYLRIRNSRTTLGRILQAETSHSECGESGGGYHAVVEFEYKVNGISYRSRQLTALPLRILKSSEKDAEETIATLREASELTVFYDERAPWDAFLLPGPLSALMIPFLFTTLFFGVATWIFLQ